jgi:hypothetical protein
MAVRLLFLFLFTTWLACGHAPGAGEPCGPNARCVDALRCVDGKCIKIATARDKANEVCRQTRACRRAGLCTAGPDECVAGSDADCRQTAICEDLGMCRAVNGACVK